MNFKVIITKRDKKCDTKCDTGITKCHYCDKVRRNNNQSDNNNNNKVRRNNNNHSIVNLIINLT